MMQTNNLFRISTICFVFFILGCRDVLDIVDDYRDSKRIIDEEYYDKWDSLYKNHENIPFYNHIGYDSVDKKRAPSILKDSISLFIEKNQSIIVIQNNHVTCTGFFSGMGYPKQIKLKRSDFILVILNEKQTFYLDYRRYNTIMIKSDWFNQYTVFYKEDNVYFQ